MHNPVEGNMPVSELTLPQDRDEAAPAEDLLALAYHDESDQAHVMNDRQRTCRAAASQGVVQGRQEQGGRERQVGRECG